jgi:hypothetical protein
MALGGAEFMNYLKIYDQLINYARRNPPQGYSESHHIIPRCIGGCDEQTNLIRLSARQHFVAHLLLAKIHGGKLIIAAFMMMTMKRYNARQYEWVKIEHAKIKAQSLKQNHIAKGSVRSAEYKAAVSARMMGHKFNIGRKASVSTKDKQRVAKIGKPSPRKGVKLSSVECEKIRQRLTGKKQSPETIAKRVKHLLGNQFAKGKVCHAHIEQLRILNTGRKMDAAIVAKRVATRRAKGGYGQQKKAA